MSSVESHILLITRLIDKQWLLVPAKRPLLMLMSGQMIMALAGLAYGKLTAVYIAPDVWGDYSLWFVAMTLLHGVFISPALQSFKAALSQFSCQPVIAFYGHLLLLMYLTIGPLLALSAGLYYQNPVFGLVWIAAVGQGIYQFSTTYLNASGQHRAYTLLHAGCAISTVLSFMFVVIGFNNRTATGLWQATLLVNTGLAIVAIWLLIYPNGVIFSSAPGADSTELRRTYRQYVWPLVSLAFWGWLINYADRYLIRLYLTDADVGQYAMGYSLGSKLVWLAAPLLAFLSPHVLNLRTNGQTPEQANPILLSYLIRYVGLAGMGCLLFYVGRVWIGQWLLSDRYAPAFVVGPIIATGYLFLTSIHLLELKWYAFGQTPFVLWHNILGAILNIGFNLLLIPRMGIVGAALAALLGFAGQFLLVIGLFLFAKARD